LGLITTMFFQQLFDFLQCTFGLEYAVLDFILTRVAVIRDIGEREPADLARDGAADHSFRSNKLLVANVVLRKLIEAHDLVTSVMT
jgi:hypothetical protein